MEWNEEPMGDEGDRAAPLTPVQRRRVANVAAREQQRQNAIRQQRQLQAAEQDQQYMIGIHPAFQIPGPAQQSRHLQAMADQAAGAISKEMDARRASFREARRLRHEKDMLLLRLQAERDARLGR